jgi:hypothetical protein
MDSVVHEAYSFVCMNCGHAWERSYEIRDSVDLSGVRHVDYSCAGARAKSPISSPVCDNCDGHRVRILAAGQVQARHG